MVRLSKYFVRRTTALECRQWRILFQRRNRPPFARQSFREALCSHASSLGRFQNRSTQGRQELITRPDEGAAEKSGLSRVLKGLLKEDLPRIIGQIEIIRHKKRGSSQECELPLLVPSSPVLTEAADPSTAPCLRGLVRGRGVRPATARLWPGSRLGRRATYARRCPSFWRADLR